MAQPIGRGANGEDLDAIRDRTLQCNSLITTGVCYPAIAGMSTFPSGSFFTADQNYFLAAVLLTMSATVSSSTGTNGEAVALMTGVPPPVIPTGGTLLKNVIAVAATVLAQIAITDAPKPDAKPFVLFQNFAPYGIYLTQGATLSLVPGNRTDTTRMAVSCMLYLLPSYTGAAYGV